jgi:hypothetical protein
MQSESYLYGGEYVSDISSVKSNQVMTPVAETIVKESHEQHPESMNTILKRLIVSTQKLRIPETDEPSPVGEKFMIKGGAVIIPDSTIKLVYDDIHAIAKQMEE